MTGVAPGLARRVLAAVEPWYNWGTINFERFDTVGQNGEGGEEGNAHFFDLQWFSVHVSIHVGRLPPRRAC